MQESIVIKGARVHNLKNIDVEIPRKTMTVVTGISGSGKSSLAFDTIYAEGQRRYVESLSSYARMFLGQMESLTWTPLTAFLLPFPLTRRLPAKTPALPWVLLPKFTIICAFCGRGSVFPIVPSAEKRSVSRAWIRSLTS